MDSEGIDTGIKIWLGPFLDLDHLIAPLNESWPLIPMCQWNLPIESEYISIGSILSLVGKILDYNRIETESNLKFHDQNNGNVNRLAQV